MIINFLIQKVRRSAFVIANSTDRNPVFACVLVAIFYIGFNALEAMIEQIIFGERFLHWLDPTFAACFIMYAGVVVQWCSVIKSYENKAAKQFAIAHVGIVEAHKLLVEFQRDKTAFQDDATVTLTFRQFVKIAQVQEILERAVDELEQA